MLILQGLFSSFNFFSQTFSRSVILSISFLTDPTGRWTPPSWQRFTGGTHSNFSQQQQQQQKPGGMRDTKNERRDGLQSSTCLFTNSRDDAKRWGPFRGARVLLRQWWLNGVRGVEEWGGVASVSEEEVESRDDEGQELSHLIHLVFAHLKQHTRAKT